MITREQAVAYFLKEASHLPRECHARIVADVAMPYDYPDEHVAYLDTVSETGELVNRQVLVHSKDLPEVVAFVRGLDKEVRRRVHVDFMENPNPTSTSLIASASTNNLGEPAA
jgi:hypothetical protein